MERKPDKVILFPKWKHTLEQESLLALEQQEYEKALVKLNLLLDYNYQTHEILMGKIICLMELNRYDEAQDLCEWLLKNKDENANYYHYLHIYLTILFQTNQYQLLMDQVEMTFMDESVPEEMVDMFQQLYDMSKSMQHEIHLDQSRDFLKEFSQAVRDNDHRKQWHLIEKLKYRGITAPKDVYTYLSNDDIHPVVKTNLFEWLQESKVDERVDVQKESGHVSVEPASFPLLNENKFLKQMTLLLSEQEQKNPSQFHLMENLLYRYLYVCYPIVPDDSELEPLAEALKYLGESYLPGESVENGQSLDVIEHYIHDLQLCDTLYLSILDDSF